MNKEEFLKLGKQTFLKYGKIILIALIILVLIAGSAYIVIVNNGSYKEDDWSNTGYAVEQIVLSEVNIENIKETSEGWALGIDLDAKVDEVIAKLEEEGGDVQNYISSENLREYLKTFIKAELITQYPDLRNADKIGTETADNEFQGCIQIHKALSNGGTQILTYLDYATFETYMKAGNSEAINHFSLNDKEEIVVAGWTRTTTTVTSNEPDIENINGKVDYMLIPRTVNYKTVVRQYSMPFDFLWALTVLGDDEDFAYEVAKLALDSKIVLTVQENFSLTHTTNTVEYDGQEKVEKTALFTGHVDDETFRKNYRDVQEKTPVHYKTETKTKIENSSVKVNVTEADTWILKYENTVTNGSPDNPPIPEQKESQPDTDYELVEEPSITQEFRNEINEKLEDYMIKEFCDDNEEIYEQKKEADEIDGTATNLNKKVYSRKLNQVVTYNSTYTSNKYELGTPTVTEKVEKDSDEENFVTLFVKSSTAKSNILSAPEWLFEMLENSPKTANMIDLVKYLLYKATGIDYGVTEYTFNVIDITSMNAVRGNSTENFIKAWENGTLWKYETGQSETFPTGYLTEDETGYIVYEDGSRGHNNIAYGWATFISSNSVSSTHPDYANHPQYGPGYWNLRGAFSDVGISVENLYTGAFVDKEAATAAFQNTILPNFINKVETYLAENLPEYEFSQTQKDSLVSVCYQRGNINGFKSAYLNSLKEDGTVDAEKIRTQFVVNGTKVFDYSGTVNDRKYANWLLFTQGIYIDRAGNEITMGTLVDYAYMVADHFLNSGVDVHYAGNSVDRATNNGRIVQSGDIQRSWDAPIENPQRYGIVCATFVSMAIWQAGYIDEDTINQYAYHGCSGVDSMIRNSEYAEEWQIINNWDELLEGDIVYIEGHVFIFMEGEKCLDQGYCAISSGGYDGRRVLTNAAGNRSKFIRGYRYIGKK